jgi:hypothetical protein
MQVIHVEEGQSIGEALANAGAPDEVVNLVGQIFGEDPVIPTDDDEDDDFDVEFEPDFELSDEPEELSLADKTEAVAQLGRIIEGLTLLVEDHASLLKKLVA